MRVGIDTLNIDRVKNTEKFVNTVLSEKEIDLYNSFNSEKRKLEFLCGRFSLKESFVKASNLKNINFKEVTILNKSDGTPVLYYKDYKTTVSISHEKTHVVTICIVMQSGE